jgi:hypothetical protein
MPLLERYEQNQAALTGLSTSLAKPRILINILSHSVKSNRCGDGNQGPVVEL